MLGAVCAAATRENGEQPLCSEEPACERGGVKGVKARAMERV